jgi:hypothetical protein
MYIGSMTDHKAARLRLHPTTERGLTMGQIAGVRRFVDHLALGQRLNGYWDGREIRA